MTLRGRLVTELSSCVPCSYGQYTISQATAQSADFLIKVLLLVQVAAAI
jgi:hypothetical protein